MTRDFINLWSDWAQNIIGFLDLERNHGAISQYLGGPCYRFAISKGVCGESAFIGVMVPSVDLHGTPFPFAICARLPEQCNPLSESQRFEDWYMLAEKNLHAAKAADFDATKLTGWLQQLDGVCEQLLAQPRENRFISPDGGQLAIRRPFDSDAPIVESYQDVLDTVLTETCFAYSIWWTTGNNSVSSSMLVSQGLPPCQHAIAMFDGEWNEHGWGNDANQATASGEYEY